MQQGQYLVDALACWYWPDCRGSFWLNRGPPTEIHQGATELQQMSSRIMEPAPRAPESLTMGFR